MENSRARLYIDGYNFYVSTKKAFGRRGIYLGWCDFERLARKCLLPEKCELVEIKYFTAPVGRLGNKATRPNELPEEEKQRIWLEAVDTTPKLKRINGYYAPDEQKFRVEKQTDVNIAVEMVQDAALHNDFDLALLITADLDLRPAALAVAKWERQPKIDVAVWFPPGSHSPHWDENNPNNLSCNTIKRVMLEESRLREDIRSIHCPDEWRKPA